MRWEGLLKKDLDEMGMFEQESLSRRRLSNEQIDAALRAVGVKAGIDRFSDSEKAVDELIQRLEDHLKDVPPPDMSGYDGPDDR
tara:strand:- start:129 stop:380 length:252 start_codon:yes stop_codon:yes gene_type:complete